MWNLLIVETLAIWMDGMLLAGTADGDAECIEIDRLLMPRFRSSAAAVLQSTAKPQNTGLPTGVRIGCQPTTRTSACRSKCVHSGSRICSHIACQDSSLGLMACRQRYTLNARWRLLARNTCGKWTRRPSIPPAKEPRQPRKVRQ